MLRRSLVTIAALISILGAVALVSGAAESGIMFLALGALVVGAVVLEQFRYKALEKDRPGPGWDRTAERFVDDETGKTVTVYVEPKTGERIYVQE